MENYIQLRFGDLDAPGKEILVAQLADIGFEGFEEGTDYLIGCIEETLYDEAALLDAIDSARYTFDVAIIEQKNWNEQWERSFEPVVVGDFCAIRAGFHLPVSGVQHDLVITPKMSFGTGHHATTFLVIQLMQLIGFSGRKVLDFGTGTGVLAILAEKLQADYITAIDNDDWSITNAQENILQNNCLNINLEKANTINLNESFDVILANINKNVIIANLPALAKHLQINGVLVLSGLLKGDYQEIVDCASKEHLVLDALLDKNDWIALQFSNVNTGKNNPGR